MEYVIGDRVCAVHDIDHIEAGDTGTVTSLLYGLGVAWDKYNHDAHNLEGACENGHGWWVGEEDVELIENNSDYDMISATDEELNFLYS